MDIHEDDQFNNKNSNKLLKIARKLDKSTQKEKVLSCFAKPGPISAELAAFLGVDATTEMARTDVTREITKYIKENDLQNPENRREIICDEPLRNLLKPGEDVLTYFILQTYLTPHLKKKESGHYTKGARKNI